MNKDEVVKVLQQRIDWNNQSLAQTSDPDGFMRNENEAYTFAINIINKSEVEKISEVIEEYSLRELSPDVDFVIKEDIYSLELAQAIVTYLTEGK
jgi:hypothetical protein